MKRTYTVTCKGNDGFHMEFTIVADNEKLATDAALLKCSRITIEQIVEVKVTKQ